MENHQTSRTEGTFALFPALYSRRLKSKLFPSTNKLQNYGSLRIGGKLLLCSHL
jgi:hypothetical protein